MIRATYRLQFHKGFGFSDAVAHASYFSDLGISHIYSSPILAARAGSLHGYDVIDHGRINPELGGEAGFRAMAAALGRHGIGIILDIVPNHMAVGKADNSWWLDLLEKGRASAYAEYFDIDWDTPRLEGKVFAPFLSDPPDVALAKNELKLIRDTVLGKIAFAYFEHRFPLRPEDQQDIVFGEPSEILLARQNFVLADWREADTHLNWRRFFDITDLAALRPNRPDVFEALHAKTFELYGENIIQGVRVDHVDGIADPALYCSTLRSRLDAIRPGAYIAVEKILAETESLPPDWPVNGTSGYDFMNDISALEHEEDHDALEELWQRQSGRGLAFEQEEQRARTEMLLTSYSGQRASTIRAFAKILQATPDTIDAALSATIVRLRSYRSYATGGLGSPGAGPFLTEAFARSGRDLPHLKTPLFALEELFARDDGDPLVMDALRRFSQLSAPVAAKAVEDTAFYRYGRILSRNDVGFDPRRHFMNIEMFHARVAARASSWPSAMLTTATHDHKRGEDARARVAVLSHLPGAWEEFLAAAPCPHDIDGADRYQLYQTLLGAWPDDGANEFFAQRIEGWCRKYLREAKLRSSWAEPNEPYEAKFRGFARNLILADDGQEFRGRLIGLIARLKPAAELHTFLQIVMRTCLPGVPDLYQGCEFEDLSLVDPDNRRDVDFTARAEALKAGRVAKQAVIARLLSARRQDPDLWARGDYQRLPLEAPLIAFSRSHQQSKLMVFARRRMDELGDAAVTLDRGYRDCLTDRSFGPGRVVLGDLLRPNPAAVLYAQV